LKEKTMPFNRKQFVFAGQGMLSMFVCDVFMIF